MSRERPETHRVEPVLVEEVEGRPNDQRSPLVDGLWRMPRSMSSIPRRSRRSRWSSLSHV